MKIKELDNDDRERIIEKFEQSMKRFPQNRYRGGRPKNIYLSITIKELCDLFNITDKTLNRWIKENRLNPNSLQSICDRYCFHIKGHI